jgi:hypothetical protein
VRTRFRTIAAELIPGPDFPGKGEHELPTRVREIERGTVTPAMKRIEAEDPERRLAGLEHSLKGKGWLTEKVAKMANELGHPADQAIGLVKDARARAAMRRSAAIRR